MVIRGGGLADLGAVLVGDLLVQWYVERGDPAGLTDRWVE